MPENPDAILSIKMCGENNHSSYNPNHPLKQSLYDYIDKEFDSVDDYEVAIIGTGNNPNYAKEIANKLKMEDKDNVKVRTIDPELNPHDRYEFEVVPETYQEHYGLSGKSDKGKDLAKHVSKDLKPGFFGIELCNHQDEHGVEEIEKILSSNGYSVESRGYFPPGSMIGYKEK